MPEIIYYTGIGAKKSGKHTPNEFTKIMNKKFEVECSTLLARRKIPSCKKFSKMVLSRLESIKVKPKQSFGVRVGMHSLVNPSKKSSNKFILIIDEKAIVTYSTFINLHTFL